MSEFRSPAYLAAVRTLACRACGRKPAEAAHSNLLLHGKARSSKSSDASAFPLCRECHRLFDQGGVLDRDQADQITHNYVASTHIELMEIGVLVVKEPP